MITIYEHTLREDTLDGCDEADTIAYDQKIGEFLQYLAKKAESKGIEITCSKNDPGIAYSADTDQEHEFWIRSHDFWEWYDPGSCPPSWLCL